MGKIRRTGMNLLWLLLVIVMVVVLMPVQAFTADGDTATYEVTVTITKVTKSTSGGPFQNSGSGYPKYIQVSTDAGGQRHCGVCCF